MKSLGHNEQSLCSDPRGKPGHPPLKTLTEAQCCARLAGFGWWPTADTFCFLEQPRNVILTNPRSWRWKIIKPKYFEKKFAEISDGARKRGKNGNFVDFLLGSAKFGSTGRQNAQESGFRSFTPFSISNYEGLSKYGVLAQKWLLKHFWSFSKSAIFGIFWPFKESYCKMTENVRILKNRDFPFKSEKFWGY